MRDFTTQMYAYILQQALHAKYQTVSLHKWFIGVNYPQTIILRHDVDRYPHRALALARIENEYGCSSTYYFRYKQNVFLPEIVKAIASLGHEIGYHYEILADAGGDIDNAKKLFNSNLKKMRTVAPITTAAMHGRPLSPYKEIDFWSHASLTDYNLTGEAYLSFRSSSIPYLNDTGRSWMDGVHNLRDKMLVESSEASTYHYSMPERLARIQTTEQLAAEIKAGIHPVLYLSFHPERWTEGHVAHSLSAFQDCVFNVIKRILRGVRDACS